jgi:predicted DNA-binding transcriptional regulator AlpA
VAENPDYITVKEACAIVGGTKPISEPTYYRGVREGRFPAPERPSPNVSRVRRPKLLEVLNRGADKGEDA